MPRQARLLFLLLLVSVSAHGQQQAKRVLLWRLDGPGSVVYLLGSVHIGRPGIYPLNDYIEEAFSRSTRLVVEVDITRVEPAVLQASVLAQGMQREGRTLREEIGPKTYGRLKERLSKMDMPSGMFDRLRPWLVWVWLAAQDGERSEYAGQYGVDLHFLKRAEGREVIELETMEQQIGILAGLSDREQRRLLEEQLQAGSGAADDVERLMGAWLAGDAERLLSAVSGELGPGGSMVEVFLRRRDVAMAERVKDLLTRPGESFVVVGALHLLGEGSVVDLLRRDGYAVMVVSETRADTE